MKIRKAKKEDLEDISKIFKIESAKKPYAQEWTKKTSLEKITKSFREDIVHIAVVNEEIVGFIISRVSKDKQVYIDEFWIKKHYQKKGVGKALIKLIEKECKKKGAKSIRLIANQKSGAIQFYKKLKYKINPTFVCMSKKIK